jgi:hypothetical protein
MSMLSALVSEDVPRNSNDAQGKYFFNYVNISKHFVHLASPHQTTGNAVSCSI